MKSINELKTENKTSVKVNVIRTLQNIKKKKSKTFCATIPMLINSVLSKYFIQVNILEI